MRKLPYVILGFCIVISTIVFAGLSVQSATFPKINWSTAADSPIARHEAAGALLNGKLYVFGGYTNDGTLIPNLRSDVYDPVENTWTQIANMPKPGCTHAGTQAYGGKYVYFAGGYCGPGGGANQTFATTAVWRYNADTNSWLAMPSLPEARAAGALAELGGKLHFFGGADINRKDKAEHWVLSLNAINQGWTSAAPLLTPRNHLGRAVLGGKIYAIGGQKGTNDRINQLTNVDAWDPVTNKWTPVTSLPKARSHISGATFAMDNKWIIVAGGMTNTTSTKGLSLNEMTLYDPQSKSWQAITPLPRKADSGIARSIGKRIFYITGSMSKINNKGETVSTSAAATLNY